MADSTNPISGGAGGGGISRRTLTAAAVMAPFAGLGLAGLTRAQDASQGGVITSTGGGDVPTTGGMRPGPGGERPVESATAGIAPIAMTSEKLNVDSEVYAAEIIDQAMQDPTGPFVVAWYPTLGSLGRNGNVVVAGHVDYYSVGEAVFWDFWQPGAEVGDQIVMTGEDGSRHTYEVQKHTLYENGSLTAEIINNEVTGPTRLPTLTVITCGGQFDAISGEYLSRIVVRCNRVSVEPPA
jgi:hypothetical protein